MYMNFLIAGGQKLTFLSKQPLLTAGNSSHQITKAFMKIQLTSVAATTTNTITTMVIDPGIFL
jgi:hypothetical protein